MNPSAEAVCEALSAVNWPTGFGAPWGVDAVDVGRDHALNDDVYVNSIDTHVDGDYLHWFLVEVVTRTAGDVYYLAVFYAHTYVECTEWFPYSRKFFDIEALPTQRVRRWFIDWLDDHHTPDYSNGKYHRAVIQALDEDSK